LAYLDIGDLCFFSTTKTIPNSIFKNKKFNDVRLYYVILSGVRTSLLGSHPGDYTTDEPAAKVQRIDVDFRREADNGLWGSPAVGARQSGRFSIQSQSRYADEERDAMFVRERLARNLDDARPNVSSLLDLDVSRTSASTRWGSAGDRTGSGQSQMVGSLGDVTGSNYDQLNQGRASYGRDDVRSLLGRPIIDRDPYDLMEPTSSSSALRSEGVMRQRGGDWNDARGGGSIGGGVNAGEPDASYSWNRPMARGEACALGNTAATLQSSSPVFGGRNQWSRGEREEDLRGAGGSIAASRWQNAGITQPNSRQRDDSPKRDESTDQTDTVNLLLNLSQLLA
jgi:hypothetical protein